MIKKRNNKPSKGMLSSFDRLIIITKGAGMSLKQISNSLRIYHKNQAKE